MRPALTLPTRRATSSRCLFRQYYFELESMHKQMTLALQQQRPTTQHNRLPVLWFLATTRPLTTQALKRKENDDNIKSNDLDKSLPRQFHPRNLNRDLDLDQLFDFLTMAKHRLREKRIYKTLRTALYNVAQYDDPTKAWRIYQAMVQFDVDKYLTENQYGQLLSILKYGHDMVPNMMTVLENMKHNKGASLTNYHISQVLFAMSRQGLVREACDLIRSMTAETARQSTNNTSLLLPNTNHFHSLAVALKNSKPTVSTIETVTELMMHAMKTRRTSLNNSTISLMVTQLTQPHCFAQLERLTLKFLANIDSVVSQTQYRHKRRPFNLFIYTALITGFARQGNLKSAKQLFEEMQKHGIKQTQVTMSAMAEAYGRAGDFDALRTLLAERRVIKNKSLRTLVATSMVVNAIRQKQFEVAEETVEWIEREIKPEDQDGMLRTAMLWLRTKHDMAKAREMFEGFYRQNKQWVNSVMVNHLVGGYGEQGDKEQVLRTYDLHRRCLDSDNTKTTHKDNHRAQHYLTHALFQCRDVPAALSVFGTMRSRHVPDDITLSMVVQGLVQNHEGTLAWRLFKTLQSEGIEPSLHAYTSIIKALGHRDSNLRKSDRHLASIHPDILRKAGIRSQADYFHSSVPVTTEATQLFRRLTGFTQPHVYTYTTLIACFAKHDIMKAVSIFDHMCAAQVEPTVQIYTALLQGCAIFRNADVALTIYNHMRENGVEPNTVTWHYLLKALVRSRADKKVVDSIGELARKSLLDNKENKKSRLTL
ncbi:MAG: hypothetical protein EXX96DRAFT_582108 [Benjaminiella poitrasii]|nr:MAG: hypothetical protein EXX96DRAFT_582108 [Benjaminiella poitrasii]